MAKDKKPETDLEKLQAQLKELQAKLDKEVGARTAAEQRAEILSAAQGMGGLHADIEGVPTGKMLKVKRCKEYVVKAYKDDGRPILEPKFETVELPTYMYKINLPPSAGWDVSINGQKFYHGNTYEMDVDTMRSVADMVARNWAHERNIRGEDENERAHRQMSRTSITNGKVVNL